MHHIGLPKGSPTIIVLTFLAELAVFSQFRVVVVALWEGFGNLHQNAGGDDEF